MLKFAGWRKKCNSRNRVTSLKRKSRRASRDYINHERGISSDRENA